MKKFLSILFVVATMLALTACGKFTCDICGQEKSGKKHKKELLGKEIVMCNDCHSQMEKGLEELGF